MLFDVRIFDRGHWCVVSVVGDVDLASFPSLRTALEQADGERVALDLSSVDYLDPISLGVIISANLRMSRRDGRFVVVCPPGGPRELLGETRLDEIVVVVDELPETRA